MSRKFDKAFLLGDFGRIIDHVAKWPRSTGSSFLGPPFFTVILFSFLSRGNILRPYFQEAILRKEILMFTSVLLLCILNRILDFGLFFLFCNYSRCFLFSYFG